MKLLPKSEVDRAKSADRQREINEGIQLAKKVDTLREIHAEEEASLTKFRDKSLKEIVAEINQKILERDSLDSTIGEKRQELLQLSGPLDRAWLFYVNSEKKEIDRTKRELEQRLTAADHKLLENQSFAEKSELLRQKELQEIQDKRNEWDVYVATEKANLEKLKADTQHNAQESAKKLVETQKLAQENETERKRLTVLRQEHLKNLEYSKQLFESSKKAVLDAENKARIILEEAKKTERIAIDRNASAAIRETNIKLAEDNLAKKEREVEDRELQALAKELLYYSPVKKKNG